MERSALYSSAEHIHWHLLLHNIEIIKEEIHCRGEQVNKNDKQRDKGSGVE
jgi:hypothetical protein